MTWEAWFTTFVVVALLAILINGRISPAAAVLGGTVVLYASGIIDTEQALAGFSNPAPLTVAALYVVAAAIQKTGALQPVLHGALGNGANGIRLPLARLAVPTAAASAFLNNTPIMAMLIPQVTSWAQRRRVSVSKLLMPLSFATILGGVVTVIGTSTNLVVSGLMLEAGIGAMGFFEIGKVGLPVAVVGLALVLLLAPRVLPARLSIQQELEESARRYFVEMSVVVDGPVDGLTVEQAGLRDLEGVFLTSVDRGDTVIAPVRPETVLRGGNVLRFSGQAGKVLDLQGRPGLESAESEHIASLDDPAVRYFEAVIGARSPLNGRTLVEVGFRSKYQAAVVAIHRDGELLDVKLGRVRLRVGDTLIVISDPGFRDRWSDREDFLLIAPMGEAPPQPLASWRSWFTIAVLVAIVVLAALSVVPILMGALVGAMVLVVAGVLTASEARRSIDIEVIVIIAAAFGLAAAMETSGLAVNVAQGIVSALDTWGERGVLLGVILATVALTEMITNNAAALLMFPIGMSIAAQTDLNPTGVAIAIAAAASASFLTPIGYQTNTMVYGPGGYRFGDYWRLGFPLTLVVVVLLVALVPVIWP